MCLILSLSIFAEERGDHKVTGHVKCNNEDIPFATILVKGTTIGTASDDKGNFKLQGLPEGTFIIRAQAVGYKAVEKTITIKSGEVIDLDLELTEDAIGLEQVVVTGDRNEKNRKEASVIVNTLTSKLLTVTQNNTLSDGLNFCPGLRMENNCQNCGFTQLRMNGMEGSYSQILINSRPIFSGLAGVYGLELIPANMIERVEVIRGGGSALYGSNAIAGTVNLITKDPTNNSYEVSYGNSITGIGVDGSEETANDHTINFNTSFVTEDGKTGLTLFGFHRNKDHWDANNDGFSEISEIKNTTIGAKLFHRFGYKSRLSADFFNINEKRRGGNKFEYPVHAADIAEAIQHEILTGALNYEYFLSSSEILTVFASGQKVDRGTYYGDSQAIDAYGETKDFTYSTGATFKGNYDLSSFVAGFEYNGSHLEDKKLGYFDPSIGAEGEHVAPEMIADQDNSTFGAYFQYDYQLLPKLKTSFGLRYDHYKVTTNPTDHHAGEGKKVVDGDVFSPRVNILYDILKCLQARVSYAQGYKAPRIFDEDLHIETTGLKQIIHKNDPNLKKESSESYTASLDFSKKFGKVQFQLLAEGFYTKLKDPFVSDFEGPDDKGIVINTRKNDDTPAKVKGVNIEMNIATSNDFVIKSGFTIQSSKFGSNHEDFPTENRFLRSPDNYGFLTIDTKLCKNLFLSSTTNYTGKMLVPYHVGDENQSLRKSDSFYDLGAKLRYNIKMKESTVQLYAGVKNLFNQYQDDFDKGPNRDAGYIYGPANPRTIYFGIKIGNLLN
jgi:outer membrane receptor for ferrienterochelin and colicins